MEGKPLIQEAVPEEEAVTGIRDEAMKRVMDYQAEFKKKAEETAGQMARDEMRARMSVS